MTSNKITIKRNNKKVKLTLKTSRANETVSSPASKEETLSETEPNVPKTADVKEKHEKTKETVIISVIMLAELEKRISVLFCFSACFV